MVGWMRIREHERLIALVEADREHWRTLALQLTDRQSALTEQLQRMVAYGPAAGMSPQAVPEGDPPDPLPPPVAQAVLNRSAPFSYQSRRLAREAKARLDAGMEPDQVAELVLNGEEVEW